MGWADSFHRRVIESMTLSNFPSQTAFGSWALKGQLENSHQASYIASYIAKLYSSPSYMAHRLYI